MVKLTIDSLKLVRKRGFWLRRSSSELGSVTQTNVATPSAPRATNQNNPNATSRAKNGSEAIPIPRAPQTLSTDRARQNNDPVVFLPGA